MKIIIPMAGMGTRMRPHTLVTPKPLLYMAGRTIIERIISDLHRYTGCTIEEIHFVIGNFGKEVEGKLLKIADNIHSKGFIHYQTEALGTAHAVYCAKEALKNEIIVAFADTLFVGDMKISESEEAIIWTLKVNNPESYGVVMTDEDNIITDFVEKPTDKISDKAIIGIYYFRKAQLLANRIEELIRNKITVKGEYQLTDALKNMLNDRIKIKCKTINQWLDCGSKNVFLESTAKILFMEKEKGGKIEVEGNLIIEPVHIGRNTIIKGSKIGPNVSIEDNVEINNSDIRDANIGSFSIIRDSNIHSSLIGNHCKIFRGKGTFSLGDYSEYEGN